MFYLSKNALLLLALIAVVLISTLLAWRVYQDNNHTNPHNPDAFAENLVGTRLDQYGKLIDKLYAPNMWHYPDTEIIELAQPKLIAYKPDSDQKPWQITADHGTTNKPLSIMDLWGNVRCYQAAGLHNAETTLTTSQIRLYPKQKLATTDQYVQATQPSIIITAIGAVVDLKANLTHLLHQVRGHYVPNS